MNRGAWRATVQGVAKSQTRLSALAQHNTTHSTSDPEGQLSQPPRERQMIQSGLVRIQKSLGKVYAQPRNVSFSAIEQGALMVHHEGFKIENTGAHLLRK